MKLEPVFRGYTWVGILNQVILQWFFIRFQAEVTDKEDLTVESFKIIGFVVPLTGWWSDYIWVWQVMKP